MGLALFKERRAGDRKKLTGLLPGRLIFAANQQDLVCRPTDVSAHGLGVVVTGDNKKIEVGTTLHLLLPERMVEMRVAWSRPDFGKQDSMRYGIVTADASLDLEALFTATGCLR